jgi:hypothetical protein
MLIYLVMAYLAVMVIALIVEVIYAAKAKL